MLTPDFKATVQAGATGGIPVVAPDQAMDDSTFDKWVNSTPTGTDTPSLAARIKNDITGTGKNVADIIAGEGSSAGQSDIRRGVEAAAEGFATPIKVASEFLPKPVRTGIEKVGEKAGDIVNWLGEKLGDTQAAQDFVMKHPDAAKTLEEIAGTGAGLGTIAGTILTEQAGVKALQKGTDLVKKGVEKAQPKLAEMKANNAIAKEEAVKVKTEKTLQSVTDDWQKPTTINKPAFNKARATLEKAPETPKFLAEHRLNPFEHVEDGKYVTSDSATALRETAGKMSSDTLRPSLQLADYTTPKTKITEVVKRAIERIGDDAETTAADKNAVIRAIKTEGKALMEEHPDGIGLTDLHDNKITYSKNAGYSPIKDPAANIKATANRALASAMQKTLEEVAPKDIPIGDFNAHLSQYYKAADYLDALNGKTAPVSVKQLVARGVARFGGAAVGGKLGGGIVTEFAGYQIGKALELALENMTNPMRATFLRNLKITNPEAFSKVVEYIGNTEAEAATRPLLPAGAEGFKNPIPLGPRVGDSRVQVIPATKNPVSANPKTGKFQTTYSSTPK